MLAAVFVTVVALCASSSQAIRPSGTSASIAAGGREDRPLRRWNGGSGDASAAAMADGQLLRWQQLVGVANTELDAGPTTFDLSVVGDLMPGMVKDTAMQVGAEG
jgi:hypothetical protein